MSLISQEAFGRETTSQCVFLNVRSGQMEQSKPPNEDHAALAKPSFSGVIALSPGAEKCLESHRHSAQKEKQDASERGRLCLRSGKN